MPERAGFSGPFLYLLNRQRLRYGKPDLSYTCRRSVFLVGMHAVGACLSWCLSVRRFCHFWLKDGDITCDFRWFVM